MSDREVHEKQSLELFGNRFREVHQFLDQYFQPQERPFTSDEHRRWLHHFEGMAEVCKNFGMIALFPAAIHILEDCLGFIPHQVDYEQGRVDRYGRPINSALIDTKWFERLKEKFAKLA